MKISLGMYIVVFLASIAHDLEYIGVERLTTFLLTIVVLYVISIADKIN